MRVLVIPEDFRNDRHLLKPLFKKLFDDLGSPRAHIVICREPLLGGVQEALKFERIQEVIERHDGMTDVFILCVDRDGVQGRRTRLDQIQDEFGNGRMFLAENAWEEIETWVLAGLDLPRNWRWRAIRTEVHVKEQYFEPLATQRGIANRAGGGRKTLGEEAARRIAVIRQKCPEDFDALARRLEAVL